MIRYKIYHEINNNFIENFTELCKNCNSTLFNNLYWIKSNIDVFFKKKDKIFFIIFFEEGIPIAFYPLIVKSYGLFRVLTFLNSQANDYCGPVIKKWTPVLSIKFTNLWNEIKHKIKYDLVYFEKINKESLNQSKFLFKTQGIFYQNTYLLNLKNLNFEKFYKHKNNKKSIQTDRRKEKKLIKNNFALKEINLNLDILKNHTKSKEIFYKKKNIKTFDSIKLFKFYSKVIELDQNRNINFKYFQYTNNENKIISSLFGVFYKKVFYYLMPLTVKSEFIQQSPGSFLLKKLIEKFLIDHEKELIDFGPGDEIYKKKWCDQINKIYYILELKSINGIFYYIYKKLYFVLRGNYFFKRMASLLSK